MELVRAMCPDVVIVDADLFDDGLENVGTIVDVPAGPNVIVLMARGERESIARVVEVGVAGCVLQQSPLSELITAIRAVAGGHKWLSPPLLTAVLSVSPDERRARAALKRLSRRELEVLEHMVRGHGQSEIAAQLHLSSGTVRSHVQSLNKKLCVHSAIAAVAMARKAGLRTSAVCSMS